jgi:hypothetical protein
MHCNILNYLIDSIAINLIYSLMRGVLMAYFIVQLSLYIYFSGTRCWKHLNFLFLKNFQSHRNVF